MSAPVRTVTLNPAIDQTVTLEELRPGHVHRALAVRHDAGGKGVNVASCLADWGVPVAAAGLLGASNAAPFEALFAAKGIEDRFLRVPGETRTNIKLVDRAGGETTDINLPGLVAERASLAEVRQALDPLTPGDLVVLSGSLPDGLADATYAQMIGELRAAGARVLLDASGEPLARALAAPREALPHAIKPNRHELEAWAGRPLDDRSDLLAAALALADRGVALVVVSLGVDGALFVSLDGALHAALPPVETGSTVGAGDAMVAGVTAALHAGAGLQATARLASAFAVGKLHNAGPHLPSRERVRTLASLTAIRPAEAWACAATAGRAAR